jgi:hypothetical protein
MDKTSQQHVVGPDFLGIGAPRAGTTWLYTQMRAHPNLWLPPLKELHWFDRSRNYHSPSFFAEPQALRRLLDRKDRRIMSNFAKLGLKALLYGRPDEAAWWARLVFGRYDEDFYLGLFPVPPGERLKGEITPAYSILNADDICKIRAINPRIKLIFLVRNPIERTWSAIRFNVGQGRLNLDLTNETAVIDHLLRVRSSDAGAARQSRREYHATLKRYMEAFPPEQLLVGFYDAIVEAPNDLLDAVAEFLGVDRFPRQAGRSERINASVSADLPEGVRQMLAESSAELLDFCETVLGSYALDWRQRALEERGSRPAAISGRDLVSRMPAK